ncbi:hypothetical protein D9M68_598050 [compost metagenome]
MPARPRRRKGPQPIGQRNPIAPGLHVRPFPQHTGQRFAGPLHATLRAGIDGNDGLLRAAQLIIVGQIRLTEHHGVRQGQLPRCFRLPGQLLRPLPRIHQHDRSAVFVALGQETVVLEREQDGRGVRQPAGLDQHAAKRLDPAAERLHEQVAQGIDHRAADHAAQAPAFDQDDIVARLADQMMIDAHIAIFIDDHDGIRIRRIPQQAIEQRGLAAAQEPGDHRYADALAVFLVPMNFFPMNFFPMNFFHMNRPMGASRRRRPAKTKRAIHLREWP